MDYEQIRKRRRLYFYVGGRGGGRQSGELIPSGDMDSGGDFLIPSGDMDAGEDKFIWQD